MRRFAALYRALDESNATSEKQRALVSYFREAPHEDAAWAVALLVGKKPKRVVNVRELAVWGCEEAALPGWLFEECYEATGDLGEAVALVLPERIEGVAPVADSDLTLAQLVRRLMFEMPALDEAERKARIRAVWAATDAHERFVFHKLLTGAFRVGVSQGLVVRALAEVASVSSATMAHRLSGAVATTAAAYEALLAPEGTAVEPEAARDKPYPFFLASPLEADPATLGAIDDWLLEWKWDGVRGQLIRRGDAVALWSRGEERIDEQFPEVLAIGAKLRSGTVVDGEVVAWSAGVLPFSALQRRLGRKNPGKKILEEVPTALCAYDLLEDGGVDVRTLPQAERRARLEAIVASVGLPQFFCSPIVEAASWSDAAKLRAGSRERFVEGLMVKRKDAAYAAGRVRGSWWKWKIDPFSVDAVLLYAQRGSGKRASLYTDYTFAVWKGEELVPFAKAYSGLDDSEIKEVDRFVREHTLEKFGPVRSVEPKLVFEIAFEGIRTSTRHKSGIAVRFPRMARFRRDKTPADADKIETLEALARAAEGEAEEPVEGAAVEQVEDGEHAEELGEVEEVEEVEDEDARPNLR